MKFKMLSMGEGFHGLSRQFAFWVRCSQFTEKTLMIMGDASEMECVMIELNQLERYLKLSKRLKSLKNIIIMNTTKEDLVERKDIPPSLRVLDWDSFIQLVKSKEIQKSVGPGQRVRICFRPFGNVFQGILLPSSI